MNFSNSLNRPLARSNSQQWVGAVLSGIGETYNINIALLRVLFVCSILLPGPQVILYVIAWLIMPRR